MDNLSNFLTQKQARAKFPFLSEITLWRLRRDRKIPFYRISGKVLYKLADLERFFEAQRQGGSK